MSDKKLIQIKRWDTGEVIHSGEFDSIKDCLEDGIRREISFWRAKLNGAKLNGAKLNGAKLNGAKLNYAELNGAELNYAELNGAELNGAKLNGATGNTDRTFCLQHGRYKLVIVDDICHGGCTTKTIEEWLSSDGEDLCKSDKTYLETVTKPFIQMVINIRSNKDQ